MEKRGPGGLAKAAARDIDGAGGNQRIERRRLGDGRRLVFAPRRAVLVPGTGTFRHLNNT